METADLTSSAKSVKLEFMLTQTSRKGIYPNFPSRPKRQITQQLIHLNKARKVPPLSLAKNSLYRKRTKGQNLVDSSAGGLSQMQTLDLKPAL